MFWGRALGNTGSTNVLPCVNPLRSSSWPFSATTVFLKTHWPGCTLPPMGCLRREGASWFTSPGLPDDGIYLLGDIIFSFFLLCFCLFHHDIGSLQANLVKRTLGCKRSALCCWHSSHVELSFLLYPVGIHWNKWRPQRLIKCLIDFFKNLYLLGVPF